MFGELGIHSVNLTLVEEAFKVVTGINTQP
jgi:hypothetical protein